MTHADVRMQRQKTLTHVVIRKQEVRSLRCKKSSLAEKSKLFLGSDAVKPVDGETRRRIPPYSARLNRTLVMTLRSARDDVELPNGIVAAQPSRVFCGSALVHSGPMKKRYKYRFPRMERDYLRVIPSNPLPSAERCSSHVGARPRVLQKYFFMAGPRQ